MLITLFAPEVIVGKSIADLVSACENIKEARHLAQEDRTHWSLTHSFFADMGGFAVRFNAELNVDKYLDRSNTTGIRQVVDDKVELVTESQNSDPTGRENGPSQFNEYTQQKPLPVVEVRVSDSDEVKIEEGNKKIRDFIQQRALSLKWSPETICERYTKAPWRIGEVNWHVDKENQQLVREALGLVTANDLRTRLKGPAEWYHNLIALQGDTWILDGSQLLLVRKLGILNCLPKITKNELDDRNKGDILVKIIAVIQVIWLIMQLIARRVKGLESTQLEIVTLAFAACALLSYCMLFNKPQDPTVPTYVYAHRYPTASEMVQLASHGPFPYGYFRDNFWMPNNGFHYQGPINRHFRPFSFGIGIGASLFGCLHLIAWDFAFPTETERLLWRIASIFTAAAPWFSIFVAGMIRIKFLADFGESKFGPMKWSRYWWWFIRSEAVLYVVTRLFITIEMFRALYYLPPGVYETTWAANAPYIG
jgi:hypothetical protein